MSLSVLGESSAPALHLSADLYMSPAKVKQLKCKTIAVEGISEAAATHWHCADTEPALSKHPALLAAQSGSCVPPVAAAPGSGQAGLRPHPALWAGPWHHSPPKSATLDTLLIFPIRTLSSFFRYTLLLKARCFACTCLYSQAVARAGCGYFPEPPFPHSRLQTADIPRSAPRWRHCPQIAALGLQIQFSQRKKLKLSTWLFNNLRPIYEPPHLSYILLWQGLAHARDHIKAFNSLSSLFYTAIRDIFQSHKTRQKKEELTAARRKLWMLPTWAEASKWCGDNSVMRTDTFQQDIIMLETPRGCMC